MYQSRHLKPRSDCSPGLEPSDRGKPMPSLDLTTPSSMEKRSRTIPLPSSHVYRTQSELQLCEDMAVAEHREMNMFYRVVNGIRERQMIPGSSDTSSNSLRSSERSVTNITPTRNTPAERYTSTLETIPSFQMPGQVPIKYPPPQPQTSIFNQEHSHVSDRLIHVDDWSVAGFDSPILSPATYNHQNHLQGAWSQHHNAGDEGEDDIFDLDM
jgi:hypothetical protein